MVHTREAHTMYKHAIAQVWSGRTYPAIDTGTRWNGSPVLAFTDVTLQAMYDAGDTIDSNGGGIHVGEQGQWVDIDIDDVDPVDGIDAAMADGRNNVPTMVIDGRTLYVPEGRIWDVTPVHAVHPADGLPLCATGAPSPLTTDDLDAVTCNDCREAM